MSEMKEVSQVSLPEMLAAANAALGSSAPIGAPASRSNFVVRPIAQLLAESLPFDERLISRLAVTSALEDLSTDESRAPDTELSSDVEAWITELTDGARARAISLSDFSKSQLHHFSLRLTPGSVLVSIEQKEGGPVVHFEGRLSRVFTEAD